MENNPAQAMTLDDKVRSWICKIIFIVTSCLYLYTAGFGSMDEMIQRCVLILVAGFAVFLTKPITFGKDKRRNTLTRTLDWVFALAMVATCVYIMVVWPDRSVSTRAKPMADSVIGTIMIAVLLLATYKTTGWPLVITCVVFLIYALVGPYMPGFLGHKGYTWTRIAETMYVSTQSIFGVPAGIAATYIVCFVIFGSFLETFGAGQWFVDIAFAGAGRFRGGPAKTAIASSALMGMISGSPAANVVTTGTFTIPLMKRMGFKPHTAGAVEAVASTGGQMMPPIMGAAAFIMADVIGVSYLTIAKAALIPSVLYYLTLLAIIHLEAVSKNMGTLPPELVPSAASVLRRLYYLFPLVFLITILLMGRSVIACAYYGTVCIVILSMIRSETRFTFKRLCGALELSAKNAMMVSSCCACAGIIIGVISLTGIGYKFINVITALAGSNLLLLMAMLMVTCIILGMGVPTAPAYIIVATLGAPALMKAGVPIIAAHMFVYFYAILSVITPPVCLAAFAGAAIAETNAMKTGVTAMKLGIVAFIIPFMFVFEPALLMQGSTTEIATAFASALIGVIGIASGMQNWLLVRCRLWERALLLASGLMLIFPGLITDTIGLSSLLIVLFAQRLRKGGSPIAAA